MASRIVVNRVDDFIYRKISDFGIYGNRKTEGNFKSKFIWIDTIELS